MKATHNKRSREDEAKSQLKKIMKIDENEVGVARSKEEPTDKNTTSKAKEEEVKKSDNDNNDKGKGNVAKGNENNEKDNVKGDNSKQGERNNSKKEKKKPEVNEDEDSDEDSDEDDESDGGIERDEEGTGSDELLDCSEDSRYDFYDDVEGSSEGRLSDSD